jgi:hypothetical protein
MARRSPSTRRTGEGRPPTSSPDSGDAQADGSRAGAEEPARLARQESGGTYIFVMIFADGIFIGNYGYVTDIPPGSACL